MAAQDRMRKEKETHLHEQENPKGRAPKRTLNPKASLQTGWGFGEAIKLTSGRVGPKMEPVQRDPVSMSDFF